VKNVLTCLLLFCCLLLMSCASTPDTPSDTNQASHTPKPDWFWKPSVEGRIGGIGISGPHIKGLNAQRGLAIERAIDDIARQLGVKVSSLSKSTSMGSQDFAQIEMETYSIQTVNGEIVKAVIRELWEDPQTKQIYVWMVVQ